MMRIVFSVLAFSALALVACRSAAPTAVPATTVPAITTQATASETPTPRPAPIEAAPTQAQVAAPPPIFVSEPCRFETAALPAEVECGYVQVPENRALANGRTIILPIAIFKSTSPNPAPDPVIYLEGGPGGHALETAQFAFQDRIAPFLAERDFIIFDQRGTGLAEPALGCPEILALTFDTLDDEMSAEEERARYIEATLACRDRLIREGVDLAAYNSAANAADVEAIRQALGYDRWNLYGISYGTRLAQTVMRDFPSGVRSVILDSAYPLAADLGTEIVANTDRAFDVFFAGCAADPACNEAYPDLERVFFDLVDQLNTEPAKFEIIYVFSGKPFTVRFDGDDLIGILFQALYSNEIFPLMPEIIYEVRAGNYDQLGLLVNTFLANNEFFSVGMNHSVQCNEEIAFSDRATAEDVADDVPELAQFFGDWESDFVICEAWGAGKAAAIENQPVVSDIPTLILAGEYDPITPPSWGAAVGEGLTNDFFVEVPSVGHGVSTSDECPLNITLAFLDNPTSPPDVACIAEVAVPPFVQAAQNTAVTLIPFTTNIFGTELKGVSPEGWEEVVPGTFARGRSGLDQTVILFQAFPGISAEQFLRLLTQQLGLEETPEKIDEVEAGGRTWGLYAAELQGMPAMLAFANEEGLTYFAMLVSEAAEQDALINAVLLPGLEALDSP